MSHQWWRDAVVYQVYPRSFADSDGDGMGDLPGITERLPYLRDLGVDALWLSPFYLSPQHDAGYDVADYCDVDPRFGTLADADALIARAHELGLKVLVDIVPNHSSSEHELFQRALAAAPGSPERDMYIFRDGRGENGELPPNNWTSIFHGDAWTRVTEADGSPGQWYLHIFDTTQPDWNWENPAVHELFAGVLRFWLDRGADGFRVDVAHGMAKPAGLPDATVNSAGLIDIPEGEVPIYFDNDGVVEIYQEWRPILDEYDGDRMMVLEAWIPEHRLPQYIGTDRAHQSFNFGFLQARWGVDTMRRAIEKPLELADAVDSPTTWVLSNHDVIRHATRYGFAPEHRFGEGLSREETPDAELGLRRARAATLLMLALPGAAYLYQGEELGLPEVADIPDALAGGRARPRRLPRPAPLGPRRPRLRVLAHGQELAAPAGVVRRCRGGPPGGRRRLDPRDVPDGPAPASGAAPGRARRRRRLRRGRAGGRAGAAPRRGARRGQHDRRGRPARGAAGRRRPGCDRRLRPGRRRCDPRRDHGLAAGDLSGRGSGAR